MLARNKIQENVTVFLFLCIIIAIYLIVLTPAILSITSICIGLIGLSNILNKRFYSKGIFYNSLSLLFFIFLLVSVLTSENYKYGFERLQIKLPLVVFGICYTGLSLSNKSILLIKRFFVFVTSIVAALLLINYLIYADEIHHLYAIGQVMPTPIHHIWFSILIVFAIHYSVCWIWEWDKKREKILWVALSVFLLVFLHIYSVRTGLLAAYCLLLYHLFRFAVLRHKMLPTIIGLISFVVIISITFTSIPTLKNKLDDTKKDLQIYKEGSYTNFASISTRFISYEAAIKIWEDNKILGCGLGDVKDLTDEYFKIRKSEIETPIIPHNQFLFFMAATGLIGLLLFLCYFYYPLFVNSNYKNPFVVGTFIIMTVAFMTEPMMETQLGMSILFFFLTIELIGGNSLNTQEV